MKVPVGEELKIKIAKLPEWARQHILGLENTVREQRNQLQTVEGVLGETRVSWSAGMRPDIFLPDHAKLSIALGKEVIDFNLALDGDYIRVAANHGRIVISPDASNTFRIMTEDKYAYSFGRRTG